MFSIRSKLAAFLRPWLQSEPDLELKLGFLSSHGSAQDLFLDVSALNRLIDESSCWSFKDVRVGKLSFRLTPWSIPAFAVDVQGLHVTLTVREQTDKRNSQSSIDWSLKEKKDILSVIDPEGTALHDSLERISIITSGRNRLMTSLLNVALNHFRLQVRDIQLEVQLPGMDDFFACLLKMKDLSLEPLHTKKTCLLSGLVSAFFVSQNLCFLLLNSSSLELGFKKEEHFSCVASSSDLFGTTKFSDLQFLNLDFRTSQLNFAFFPNDLPLLLAFDTLLTKEVKRVRNGRELWNIAARRLGFLGSNPKLSLHKLVDALVLRLRHVRAYESLLLLVGYPAETIFGKSSTRLSFDKKFSVHVQNQWKAVCEIEKDLPADALAQTRRIARHRAAMHVPCTESNHSESQFRAHRKLFQKLLSVLCFLLKILWYLPKSVMHFFSTDGVKNQHVEADIPLEIVSGYSRSHYCFAFGRISFTISSASAVPSPVNGREAPSNISPINLLSFYVIFDAVFLIYMCGNAGQSLSFCCGDFKVESSSSSESYPVPLSEKNWEKETASSFKEYVKEERSALKVLWSDRAPKSLDQGKVASDSFIPVGNVLFSDLERHLEEMWLNWKKISKKFVSFEMEYLENPVLLCEIKSKLMDPCLHIRDCGVWKIFLSMGKLNFDLGYSSIISISLLLWQVQHILYWDSSNESTGVLSHSRNISKEPKEINLEDRYKSYVSELKIAMARMIPEKRIQMGMTMGGAQMRISLQEEGLLDTKGQGLYHIFNQGHGDLDIMLDLESIELAVWPSLKASLPSFTGDQRLDDAEIEYERFKGPWSLKIPGVNMSKNYICQGQIILNSCLIMNGLKTYLQKSEEKQQFQVIGLPTALVQTSFRREYVYSLTTNVTTLSTSVHGMVGEVMVSLYMDEVWLFLQVVDCMRSAALYAFTNSKTIGNLHFHEIVTKRGGSYEEDQVAEAKAASLIHKNTLIIVDASFEFRSLAMIVHNSRKIHVKENQKRVNGASTSRDEYPTTLAVSEHGIGVAVENQHIQISCKEGHARAHLNLSAIHSVIFKYPTPSEQCSRLDLNKLFYKSPYCLYEFCISDCAIVLLADPSEAALASARVNDTVNFSTSGGEISNGVEHPASTIIIDDPNIQHTSNKDSRRCERRFSNLLPLSSCYRFLMDIVIGGICLAEHSLKIVLSKAHEPEKLQSSLSVGGGLNRISWTMQGGIIFVEMAAFAMFINCFGAYLSCISNLSTFSSGEDMSSGRSETCSTTHAFKWQLLEALVIKLTNFALVLVVVDNSGEVWELKLKADLHFNFELMNLRRRIVFDLHHLAIVSKYVHDNSVEQNKEEDEIPHFSSVAVNFLSSHSVSGDPTQESIAKESVVPILYEEHSSSSTVPQSEYTMRNDVTRYLHSNAGNYMLKHGYASIRIEKDVTVGEVGCLWLKNNWVGCGSISGLDLTFSLSEMKMLLSLFAPLSSIPNEDASAKSKQRYRPGKQEKDNSSELTIPDGAVVAIQDLYQHMYFAVEGVENKYRVIGAIHYSLVGERALFRVKYCKRKSWGLPASCFTLISLHAKSGSGEPLRLNYRPGSVFIDISSTDDSSLALWKKLPYKPENYDDDKDVEYFTQPSKNTFYLVNHKCNQAVAFVEGVPEFVKKPGNLFKFKLFSDCHVTLDALRLGVPLEGAGTTNQPHNLHLNADSVQGSYLPCVRITIDKTTVTILHELPDAIEKFPLLRACIDNTEFVIQVIPMKARLIGMFTTAIFYFDARENLWREVVHPVEMRMFCHSRFAYQDGAEIIEPQKPVHFYFRSRQVDVSLTGLSLDIILFAVGELNLAGPYAVRSSLIFANCCKVENQSGLNLLCHFYDDQDATIAGKQYASIFLRQTTLANTLLEKSSFVSLQLAAIGTFRTSAIHVSLLNAGILAWRTRVLSLQDSRSYPGPFVVVHVSKRNEDGLSITASPLVRIHNETGFSLTMRFSRPQQREAESAFVFLRTGDAIDDSMAALDALNLSGGSKKALMSLCLGNFLFSFRPEITEYLEQSRKPLSSEWSEDLKGAKAVRLSGILDKLTYKFRRALGIESMKYSFSTVHCSLKVEGAYVTDLHFLIQTCGRNVPVIQPNGLRDKTETSNSPIALQEQKEIFLLPTFQVFNLLQSEIHVLLTETHPDLSISEGCNNIGKQATIACGSSTYLYGNPAIIYFTVTLTTFNSRCKPVNSGDWLKKLQKQKHDVHYLDIELDFGSGKYFSYLRLSLGERGILEAAVFTPYTLQNDSHLTFLCFSSNQKPLSRTEAEKYGPHLPPELGSLLPPKSTTSWFLKSNKVHLTLLEEKASVALLDFDVLSGFTEVCLEVHDGAGMKYISKLGVSLKPCHNKIILPSQIVLMVSRYIVSNESEGTIFVRQCYFEDEMDGNIAVKSKQKSPLCIKTGANKRREVNILDSLLKKHRNVNEDSFIFVQFHLNDAGWSWSGPICIASLGRFFLKFRRSSDSLGNKSNSILKQEHRSTEIALVHVVEEGSSLVLHFHRPTNISSPYRIENLLHNAAIIYHQKDLPDSEILGSGNSVDYIWDDLNLPHQLVVQITDLNLSREINIDKLHKWKPFFKVRQQRGLALDFPLEKMSRERRTKHALGPELLRVGYEVYADGPTRVLRISEFPNRCKDDTASHPCAKLQLMVSNFVIHLLENEKQDEANASPSYSPFLIARLGNINLNSIFTDLAKYNQIKIQSLHVDEKWVGAPFAAMLRRNQLDYSDTNVNMLQIMFIILSTNSDVKQVKYSSIILQPINLNIDEETLMRLVPFWRTSLSDSNSRSKQFYFKHFEIHPIKIVASFLPGTSDSNYSSAQETLRSLLHSVIKIPAVKNMSVELNGILVTHALVTARELFFKCAQHYSWYAMRAVYIAKGSPLLPPAFASIFDDSASSSLDVFFDPSSGLINLPGLTLGMFKLISKSIDKKGFSGTKRYFGDLGKTMKTAGSNVLFAAVTEISDCVLKGAEANGFNGMVNGFHQGILKLAMEPSLLGSAVLEGGPDRKIKLDSSPGVDELYIEGYLQAMLDMLYKQEYLRVRVIDNLVIVKNLPPNSSLMNEIMDRVKDFLISRALLKGELSSSSRPLRHLHGENEWKIGPTVLTLWEHLFVSFAIRMLRKQTLRFTASLKWKGKSAGNSNNAIVPVEEKGGWKHNMKSGFKKFIFSGLVAYIDGRLCRCIPNAIARRIVSGFLLSLLDDKDSK